MTVRTTMVGQALVGLAMLAAAPAALADTISFKLLPRYSYATFKTDAPLETVVGHTADTGLQGELTVDPARPEAGPGRGEGGHEHRPHRHRQA